MKAQTHIPVIALTLLLVVGCRQKSQGPSSDAQDQQELHEVNLSIDANQRIFVDGKVVSLGDLERRLIEMLGGDKAEFVITVAPNTPMGLVSDVQQTISATSLGSIRYPEPNG